MEEFPTSLRAIRFGVFQLDLREQQLLKKGIRLKLQSQPFSILLTLLSQPGKVVTKEELRRKLWPDGVFIDFDHSLGTAINKLREVLDDSADNPRFVETLPRRGYRFIAPVEMIGDNEVAVVVKEPPAVRQEPVPGDPGPAVADPLDTSNKTAPPDRTLWPITWKISSLALLLVLAIILGWILYLRGRPVSIRSLAVLPLENLSGDASQDYFSDGMTDELITELGQISQLRVISRTSAMTYKGVHRSLPQIAKELNVDAVIEGTVLREGDRVRITAHLIQASTDQHLWDERYERGLRSVLAMQSEMASAIAEKVQAALTPSERTRLASARPVNPDAYEAYLKGMQHWYKLTPQDLDTALEYFELALNKDPNYAAAYAGVAMVWLGRNQMGYTPPREAGPKAKAAALKAVELDNTLAQAHYSLASVDFLYEWDWAGAEVEFKRAIELNPNYPDARALYSEYLMIMKRPEEAMAQIQRALELDPLNAVFEVWHGTDLMLAGRYDEAIAQYRKALRMSSGLTFVHGPLGNILFSKAMYEESLAELKAYYAGDREMEEALTQGYTQSGYSGATRRAAEVLAARGRKTYVYPPDVAALYVKAGEKAQPLGWLEKGLELRNPFMPYISAYPAYEPLRSEPRFQDLLRRMNFPP